MNLIRIEEGIVLDIKPSHLIDDIEYDQMSVVVKNSNGKESILTLKFKKFDNKFYKVGSRVNTIGQIRSFSKKDNTGKNKVDIYVLTSFENLDDSCFPSSNILYPSSAIIDGAICVKEPLRELASGKCNIHFTIANNFYTDNLGNEIDAVDSTNKYSSYIPCIAWGKLAKHIDTMEVGTPILIRDGELRSREYIKKLPYGDEIRVCHELYVKSYANVE